MAVVHQNEEEEEVNIGKSNNMTIGPVPTTLATIESLAFPHVQEVVLLADFRCQSCQDRVADILSRLNGEADSVEISLMEKKVTLTLTRKHSKVAKMSKNELQQVANYKNTSNRPSLIKRIFHSTSD